MHSHSIDGLRHDHIFLGSQHAQNERRVWIVIVICAAMMLAEISGGVWFGSVALIADGLHMSTHAGALLIAALAYTYARRHAHNRHLAFGTGKLGDLAAFASAVALAVIALLIGYESLSRLLNPVPIVFNEAIAIAVLGLGVNVLTAFLLRDDHDHHHARAHDRDAHEHHAHEHGADEHDDHRHPHAHGRKEDYQRDNNLRAAFVHVSADAAVSVLVIIGLVLGRQFGLLWMDPLMGLIATAVILNWSWSLARTAGAVLLDASPDSALPGKIEQRLEQDGDRISDLHLWRLGPGHIGAIVSLVSDHPRSPAYYKALLADVRGLSHLTIEVDPCPGGH